MNILGLEEVRERRQPVSAFPSNPDGEAPQLFAEVRFPM